MVMQRQNAVVGKGEGLFLFPAFLIWKNLYL